ncbi:TadE/TadG family type IV pilus assembly protein [Loktanella sp. DJP18]|uniref:TadE/TadG family type IV pilus assembly protein n=1 Tax=Loktanella sp. DJP18 TaxID=3409788 RepID=UPI003BB70DA9
MELTTRIATALRGLWRREDGVMTLEFVILAPLMFWTYLATLAYFDVYRTEAISEKASMTIADLLSRERNYVNDDYIDGTYGLLQFLTRGDSTPGLRISSLRYHDNASLVNKDDGTDHFHVVWSEVRGNTDAREAFTNADTRVRSLTSQLPQMGDGDRLILVETWTHYTSAYNLGLRSVWGGGPKSQSNNDVEVDQIKDIVMETFIFTQPRFKQTCFNNTPADLTKRLC